MNALEISVGWYRQNKFTAVKREIRSPYNTNRIKIGNLGFLTIRVTK